jgi:MoxR-like ATPase
MELSELTELVLFFQKIKVTEEDVTTEEEKANGQLVVIVTYQYEDKIFTTNKLYYKNVKNVSNVKDGNGVLFHFPNNAYWLDLQKHPWPRGSKEKDLDTLVVNGMTDSEDFRAFLKPIANNEKKGFIQRITAEGRSQQYGYNLENNNHWHDLIKLIQAFINSKGEDIDKNYFSRLIYGWQSDKRKTLFIGSNDEYRKIIADLQKNLKIYFNSKMATLQQYLDLLLSKHQIILQGAPGTGKTYTAKDLAYALITSKVLSTDKTTRKEEMHTLEQTGQFKLIQFHPAYAYEDFVRGIVVESENNQIQYRTKNKILASFAATAQANASNKYVLIIDEINRANLPSVLGELIYALEYRGESVDSMYDLNGDNRIRLPTNLYIIGTMNTADRSVGHIDYAIRRRFAFLDVAADENVISFPAAKQLFQKIKEIFSKHLANDFELKDIELGHSYYLAEDDKELKRKLDYEIKPLLREYLKDGILRNEAKNEIEKL